MFFVIISLQNNKRVPSPQHQQFNSTICDTPRNRNQHSTPAKRNQSPLNNSYSLNKSLEDADVSNLNTSCENNRVSSKNSNSNKDGNSTSPKKEIAPEEQAFRRQHFDRNSILRTSKKRSRKSSMNNSTNAGNSTPNRNVDPNSNTSIKDQNKGMTPNNRTPSNGKLQGLNNSNLSQTKSFNTEQSSVSLSKKRDIPTEVNSLYKENLKNIDIKSTTLDEKKYISNTRNKFNETKFQTFGKNNYCDNGGGETKSRYSNDSFEQNDLFGTNTIVNQNSSPQLNEENQENKLNGYDFRESINTETKSVKAVSASDNVAALLGKSSSTKNYEPNSLMQPKRIDAKITKLNPAIKSNGINEHTATSGTTVIRTRREAMRQAEEEEAAKNTKKHHSSNNGYDNNGRINSSSRRNEKQDSITQEEDCGRLI